MIAVQSKTKKKKATPASTKPADVLFAPAAIQRLEQQASLPAKSQRIPSVTTTAPTDAAPW